jgi:hypothetical protein
MVMRLATVLILLTLAAPGRAQTYFPPGVLGNTPEASDAAASLYSRFLEALHEPSLWELSQQDPKAEVYRLVWLRAFDHPVAVRFVLKPGGTGWFYRRKTSGKGGAQPGRMMEYGKSWSWKSRTASFLRTVDGAGFWNLPTLPNANENANEPCRAHWILEGIKNGQYHVVDRCSPGQTDPVRLVGTLVLKRGGLRMRASRMY